MKRKTLVKLRHITHRYQEKTVLEHLHMTLPERSMVSVVGESGVGKSSLLRIIQGLEQPAEGELIRLIGTDEIQTVFQNYALFPWLTLEKNVMQPLLLRGVPKAEAKKRSHKMLEEVGLLEHAKRYPKELSGGMKQRVALARALVMKPKLLLMDEPFGALDVHTKKRLQELVLKLYQNHPISIVFVTHDLSEAIALSDRVYTLGAGRKNFHFPKTIPFARPRTRSIQESRAFQKIERELKKQLRPALPVSE